MTDSGSCLRHQRLAGVSTMHFVCLDTSLYFKLKSSHSATFFYAVMCKDETTTVTSSFVSQVKLDTWINCISLIWQTIVNNCFLHNNSRDNKMINTSVMIICGDDERRLLNGSLENKRLTRLDLFVGKHVTWIKLAWGCSCIYHQELAASLQYALKGGLVYMTNANIYQCPMKHLCLSSTEKQ